MNQKKVLIIDDDSRNIFALSAVLRAKGYHCVTAESAKHGLDKLGADEGIGAILMDMMMPEMDGYQAIAEIKKTFPQSTTPIIAVTAQAMDGDREKCLRAGATAYISKPINIDELLTVLQTH